MGKGRGEGGREARGGRGELEGKEIDVLFVTVSDFINFFLFSYFSLASIEDWSLFASREEASI